MANAEQLARLGQGVKVWNEWRRQNEDVEPDLRGADLVGADLRGADLRGADLFEAQLRGADLVSADLREANLVGADIFGTRLWMTDFWRADLSGTDLREANLFGANLSGANLSGANLGEADLLETVFGDTNLRDVRGLDACRHSGPSTVDHRTLAKSGPLPLPFLRGCGLPEKFIDYLPSLFSEAIQFYSCFISYSTKDQAFAERLYADLQNKGVRCWFAAHDMQGGKKVHEQIDEAIRRYDRLLLILSEHSMNSEWVRTEIAKARKRGLREHRRMLFPVRLVGFETLRDWECFDGGTGTDLAQEVCQYFIPDFSDWKNHDYYQKAFARLLKDLKAEENSRT